MLTRGTVGAVADILARKRTSTPPPDFGPNVTGDNPASVFAWPPPALRRAGCS